MKLYGFTGSPYVVRVVLAAHAKGLDLPANPPPGGGFKSAEYLQINPLAKMPALEDHGRHVIESMLILEYLDDAYPHKPLLPPNAMDRAQVRLFGKLSDTYLLPQFAPLFRNMNPAARNASEVEAAIAGINMSLGDIECFASASGPCLAGASVTQADCAVAPCIQMGSIMVAAFGVNDLLAATPKLARWWQHMQAHATFGAVLKKQGDDFRAFVAGGR